MLRVEPDATGDGVDQANVGAGLVPLELPATDGCRVFDELVSNES